MPRLLIRHDDTDPWELKLRAASSGITLAPGYDWSEHVIVITHEMPLHWPGLDDGGPTSFAGLPPSSPSGLPHLAPPRVDAAWDAAASESRLYTCAPAGWTRRTTGRRVGVRTAAALQQRTASRAAVMRRRDTAQRLWDAMIADNPVVPAVVSRVLPSGDAQLKCAYEQWTLLPRSEQIRRHRPGDHLVVRVTTSLGGRATERDSALLRGLARRIMGPAYCPPVVDVWPAWTNPPRVAFVLVPRDGYHPWVSAAPTLSALSGRRIRIFRDTTPPSERVRRALSTSWPITAEGRALYVNVPAGEIVRWYRAYARLLPLVGRLAGQAVWVRQDPATR